ncbi:protein fosB [Callorhinchus milii]|uniref:FBJ murine osteosarcoma viral oncogene homolog B n=1 Tax=Callorhinchus milii TaxID=7868 RepID=V9KYN8_CALMI|nr:protein fosB [Callorhinchus milii]|eukprot:gi/632985812/ref/XP_007909891.1/ PREDICTED: protein fosB [Callorhinchus milii]
MYQGFPGDFDSASRCSSSPSEPQYLSSVDSFSQSVGSPTTAAQECTTSIGDMPGSFVPTLTAITTSQDLQWMVQPTVISSMAQSQPQPPASVHPQPIMDPYNLPGTSYSTPAMCSYISPEPTKPTRASRPRRARDEMLTAEEEEKRRVRRERNKLAAAKCRNRRRELTDRLQIETDQLEEEKAELQSEVSELQKEKERLEFVLVAHKPACKIPYQDDLSPQPSTSGEVSALEMASLLDIKESPFARNFASGSHPHQGSQVSIGASMAEVSFGSSFYSHCEPLNTPVVNPSPNSSYTSSFVFTYPEGSSCGVLHQRNSSSDHSPDSLNSPSLLAL